MLRLFRHRPSHPPDERGLRYVDHGWVGCPNAVPNDASIETCLACAALRGTVSHDGAIRAIRCRPGYWAWLEGC